ncbi:MAG: glycosyltransferase family 39 protein [Candidatus Promineifilaceae bacterium]|nr:glycosyltransferase family 39 protein [Candidatus Promineifilaceae bacterium]
MPKRSQFTLIGLVWTAAIFRLPSLFKNHFHADEALFAYWARLIAVWRDPLLLAQAVDKPPLLFYLQAIFYPLMGPQEWAARLPNYFMSLLLVPLVAVVGWHCYHQSSVSVLSALLMALAPLTIQFSSSAFTDPLLSGLIVFSVLFVLHRPSPILSGLFFGLAAATKYQAWLFLPLIMGVAWLKLWNWYKVRLWLAGAVPPFLALLLWTFMRSGNFSLWSRQVSNFGGLRMARSWELFGRLGKWVALWQFSFGFSFLPILWLSGMLVLIWRGLLRRDNIARFDLLFILFSIAYLLAHWVLAVPVWDRYLLPIFPFLILIFARLIVVVYRAVQAAIRQIDLSFRVRKAVQVFLIMALLLFMMLQFQVATKARAGWWPIGGRSDADRGAWQIAKFLKDEPYGTVLYDHWYSWQWQYHLFDKGVYVSWFQSPQALVDDLIVFGSGDDKRYLVLPSSNESLPIMRAIATNGFELDQIMQTENEPGMILYRIHSREKVVE